MSPVEFPNLAGQAAPTSPTGERADADLFAGLLDDAAPPARGRFGVGRWLQDQSASEGARRDGPDMAAIASFLAGLSGGPLVNPGPHDQGKPGTDQPLVNPGPGSAQTKGDGRQVLPGGLDGKPQGPLVNPGEPAAGSGEAAVVAAALQAVAEGDQVQSVNALAQTVQQAVSRAPQTLPITPTPAPATPEPAITEPGLDAAAPSQEVAGADPTVRAEGAPASPATSANPATTEPSGAGVSNRTEMHDAAGPEEALVDPLAGESEAPAPTARSDSAAPVAVARTDAAAVAGRMSFDALAQVSAQIIRRLEARTTRFDMELNPVELGRVDVRLDIDAEGRLAARLAFDNPAAALDLRGRVDDLRRELQQAGFQLADDAFSFTDRGGSGGGRDFDADDARRTHARSAEAADQVDAAAQPALRTMTRLGLDVRV